MHFISHLLDISARPFYLIQERINVFFLFFAENCWFFSKSNFDRKRVATNAYGPKSCQKVFYRHMCITGRNSASPSLSLSPLISDWLWSFNFRDENLIICLTPRPASSWNHHSHIAIVVRPPWLKSFANQKTRQITEWPYGKTLCRSLVTFSAWPLCHLTSFYILNEIWDENEFRGYQL